MYFTMLICYGKNQPYGIEFGAFNLLAVLEEVEQAKEHYPGEDIVVICTAPDQPSIDAGVLAINKE